MAELKERHTAATETVNAYREQLQQRRQLLLDTDGSPFFPFTFLLSSSTISFSFSWIRCSFFLQLGSGAVRCGAGKGAGEI